MTTKTIDPQDFTVEENGLRIVSFCCDVVFYTAKDLSTIANDVLYIYDKFLEACPPDTLKWYNTENMSHDKPCTPRALNMLRGWLKPGAPKRPIINIELKDRKDYSEASTYSFWIWGNEKNEKGDIMYGKESNVIRCAFPGQWLFQNPAELLAFAKDVANHFPFLSGHAGYVLQTTPYSQEASETAAWKLSMKHPGLDIANPTTDQIALRREAIKGINWLTILSSEFMERIGGVDAMRQNLSPLVELVTVKGGGILKAGPEPKVGDINHRDLLPEYRAVYKVVAPLQAPIIERYGAFDLPGGDHREKTQAWLRRFADD